MAFTSLTTNEVTTGEPTSTTLMNKIKDNLDDHEDRINDVEASTSAIPSIPFEVNGNYSSFGAQTGVLYYRATFNMTILSARILIEQAGSSGSTEADLLYKRGVGAFTSIYSTRPSVAFGSGDFALSTNQVLTTTAILAGDILRLDTTSVQLSAKGYQLVLEYQPT